MNFKMASGSKRSNSRHWHSTATKFRRRDLETMKEDFTENELAQQVKRRFAAKDVKTKSRKDLRKERRAEIKAKQNASWMKKRGIEVTSSAAKETDQNAGKKKKKRKKKKQNSKEEAPTDQRMDTEGLLLANEKEDRMIASLEKKLGMKKRKNLPAKFKEDGFDYLLELCEPLENPALFMSGDEIANAEAEGSGDEPDAQPSKLKNKKNEKTTKKGNVKPVNEQKAHETEDDDDDVDCDDDENFSELDQLEKVTDDDMIASDSEIDLDDHSDLDSDFDDDGDMYDSDNDANSDHNGSDSGRLSNDDSDNDCGDHNSKKKKTRMLGTKSQKLEKRNDISNDKVKTGSKGELNISKQTENSTDVLNDDAANTKTATKYVPPHLRKLQSTSKSENDKKLERLKKMLKGLINRLSESNMNNISQEIEGIYTSNSRNDTNSVLSKLIFDACVMPSHMPEKMMMEHAMLIAILHANIGNEVGAYFIQELVEKFSELHEDVQNYSDGKECDNVLMLIAQLYNFKVIDSLLIYDIIRELVKKFTERDIEILMLILKSVGAEIRRDDPGSLKEIILEIEAKAATCSDLTKRSRVRFMLDVITALRNNNLRKIPQYDPMVAERSRKQLKAILKNRDAAGDMQLRISLKDLLQAKDKGRWWIVGSAWAGREDEANTTGMSSSAKEDNKLLSLAKQQRMNTEIRKNIFCIIMSSEDYLDCFEKLLKLNLKEKQAREIVHVLIDCCLQEKNYNPYYAFLAQKLCEFSRGNQVTFQYSFWDRFKTVSTSSSQSLENMAKLLAHLFASSALSISILKIVGFATIDKSSVRFFTRLFTILLNEYPENTMRSVFTRIAPLQKLSMLREGLKIFLRHFLLSKNSSKQGTENSRFKELVDIAEAALDGREVVRF